MSNVLPELDKKGLRDFGLITGAIVAALFGLLLPWLFDHALPIWPWVLTGALWLPALLMPNALRPVYRVWMKVGHWLGWINTRIILGVMFYLMFLPMGLIMRALGKDPMERRLHTGAPSYRVPSKNPSKNHLERPF